MENNIYKLMPFPKREWDDIGEILKEKGLCSSTRCCKELGKYKEGEVYRTPWNDLIKITDVRRYTKLEDIPTWKYFDKGMKISARKGEKYGNGKWDHVFFEKVNQKEA